MKHARNPGSGSAVVRDWRSPCGTGRYWRAIIGERYDDSTITLLEERDLIKRDSDKPGYYQLTHLGKLLMGVPTGKQLPGFEDVS
jgi:hypothetical protein